MTSIYRQAIRFVIVGILNTFVGLISIYAVIYFIHSGPVVANALGYAIGLAASFTLNKFWTFDDSRSIENVLPRYLVVAAISYLLNLGVVLAVNKYYFVGQYLVQVFGIGIYTISMFFGCRLFVFHSAKKDW